LGKKRGGKPKEDGRGDGRQEKGRNNPGENVVPARIGAKTQGETTNEKEVGEDGTAVGSGCAADEKEMNKEDGFWG